MIQLNPYNLFIEYDKTHLTLENLPCSCLSILCYLTTIINKPSVDEMLESGYNNTKPNGYKPLSDMNKTLKYLFNVKKYRYFKKNERIKLKDYSPSIDEKTIICVKGHYIYAYEHNYFSFFDNNEDEIVAIWYLE